MRLYLIYCYRLLKIAVSVIYVIKRKKMENIRQSIENMNEIYKPLIMPEENNAEDDQLLSVDSTFLQGIPKSPKKLPKLKANLNSGNWQVSFIIEFTIIVRHLSIQINMQL